jgi:hypothetical protein
MAPVENSMLLEPGLKRLRSRIVVHVFSKFQVLFLCKFSISLFIGLPRISLKLSGDYFTPLRANKESTSSQKNFFISEERS